MRYTNRRLLYFTLLTALPSTFHINSTFVLSKLKLSSIWKHTRENQGHEFYNRCRAKYNHSTMKQKVQWYLCVKSVLYYVITMEYLVQKGEASTHRYSKQIVRRSLAGARDVTWHAKTFDDKVNMSCDLVPPDTFILEPTLLHHTVYALLQTTLLHHWAYSPHHRHRHSSYIMTVSHNDVSNILVNYSTAIVLNNNIVS